MAQTAGFESRTGRCVVSCHNKVWEPMLAEAISNGDGVAAVFEEHWGDNWKFYYGSNVSRFGGKCDVWYVIHGPNGPSDLGKTQREELKFVSVLPRELNKNIAIKIISIEEYIGLRLHPAYDFFSDDFRWTGSPYAYPSPDNGRWNHDDVVVGSFAAGSPDLRGIRILAQTCMGAGFGNLGSFPAPAPGEARPQGLVFGMLGGSIAPAPAEARPQGLVFGMLGGSTAPAPAEARPQGIVFGSRKGSPSWWRVQIERRGN